MPGILIIPGFFVKIVLAIRRMNMVKIVFMGAGSTIFAKNILGDCLLTPSLRNASFALYDIDAQRLRDSQSMLENLNRNLNQEQAEITSYLGVENRRKALQDADFVINAIQVGGYEPSTVIDFEVPKKFGLRQTIADTLGIGGIFRALRTIPVLRDFAADMEDVCPDAWLLNYTNPMSILSGYLQLHTNVKTVGLCHSVQKCAEKLIEKLDMDIPPDELRWRIAGINHMAWLLEISHGKQDLYPEIRRRAEKKNQQARQSGAEKHNDMVRFEIMRHFGYYNTESSEHTAEYHPYFIKDKCSQLVEELNIPLDEYPRRCVEQIQNWENQRLELVNNGDLSHQKTHEYGSSIIDSLVTNRAISIHGNVLNNGLITNLPAQACVEVPCLVDGNGVQGVHVGELPEQLAALNRTHINVHLLAIEATRTLKKEKVYQAAMLDPHTRSELNLDQIRQLCDELFDKHGDMLPDYR